MNYIVYQKKTGVILRTGFCAETDLELQAQDGEGVMAGEASDVLDKIDLASETVILEGRMAQVAYKEYLNKERS